jgi:PAS domain S-box-containing protein
MSLDRLEPAAHSRATEDRLRAMVSSTPAIIWTADPAGNITFHNPRWLEYTGIDPADNVSDWPRRVLHPDDLERCVAAWTDALRTGREYQIEVRNRRHDGEYRWFLTRATPARDAAGRITEWYGSTTDIHDAKTAQEELRRSRRFEAFLLRLTDALRPLADPERVQDTACRLLGEWLGVDRAYFVEVSEDDGFARVSSNYLRGDSPSLVGEHRVADFGWVIPVLRRGEMVVVADAAACPLIPAADRPAMAAVSIAAHVNAPLVKGGELVGCLCVTEPTPRVWAADEVELVRETGERIWAAVERAKAEAELRSSRAFHELIAGLGSDWWFQARIEPDGTAVTELVSDGFTRLLGYTREELMAAGGWAAVVHPDDLPEAERQMGRLMAGETIEGELRHVARDGRVNWSLYRTRPEADASGRVVRVQGVARDVTDRKRAEAAVRESEERLRAVASNLPNAAVFVLGPDLRYQLATGLALAPAGFARTDLEGRLLADVLPPELWPEYSANYRRALAGQPFRAEHSAHGRHYVTHGTPLYDSGGRVTAALAVSYDITDRVRAEEQLRQTLDTLEVRVAERTAELADTLTALIAEVEARKHAQDARQELLGRLVSAQEEERRRIARELHDSLGQYLAAMNLELTAARRVAIQPETRDRLGRLAELTAETGREVHRLALELRPTALDDVGLAAAVQHYVEVWSARTGVAAEFDSRGLDGERFPWQVSTAVYRVVQECLTNVMRHARAGRVSVLLERRPDHLFAVVEDDGVGFDPDGLETPAAGSGLGLVGMRERVALVQGSIQIESAAGSGTAVYLRIPVAAAREVSMGKVRILLVDDHSIVREGLKSVLRGHPEFEVVGEAGDGPTAVARVAELDPDVVLLDVSMPGMNGAEVTARLLADRPDRRVLILTVHEDRGYLRALLGAGAVGYLLKRATADELLQAIRAVAGGGTYIDPSLAGNVVGSYVGKPAAATAELSEREVEVVRLITSGYSNKEIAARLNLSVKTVETYKARSMEKLGIRTRVGLVRYAAERGWLAPL